MAKKSESVKDKLRAYFLSHIGKVVNSNELREVADGQTEWARRVRELRGEEGYLILTHNDLKDLKKDEYLLEDPKPQPAFSRNISQKTRALVLDRNGNTCQMCGAAAGDDDPINPNRKIRLHIGHIKDKSNGGTDDLSNLRALCSNCNQGASNITLMRPDSIKLLSEVRRADKDAQLEVLKWLIRKYQKNQKDTEVKNSKKP